MGLFHYGSADILRMFRKGNVIVAGHKGRGKDLLFQYVIKARERDGEIHAANIKYTEQTKTRAISYYCLRNNHLENFINGKFEPETKFFTEKEDYYISDAGIHLPAHMSQKLDKQYPTLPTVYALSRHLGQFNIHSNTQNYARIWNKLREQADYCITCEKCRVIGRVVFQRVIIYDRPESAFQYILPYKIHKTLFHPLASKESRARADEFNARYGYIRRLWFWWIMPKYHYDTRAFYRKLYKKRAPTLDSRRKRTRNETEKESAPEEQNTAENEDNAAKKGDTTQ